MIHAEYQYQLDVSPELAFDYLANPAHDAEWQSSCLEATLCADVPAVGVHYRIVFSFMGRRTAFLSEITDRTPHHEYAFRVLEGPFHYNGRYSLRPADGGTHVHWQFWAEPSGFFGIVPTTLLRKVLVSQVERDVIGLRRVLAQRHPALNGTHPQTVQGTP